MACRLIVLILLAQELHEVTTILKVQHTKWLRELSLHVVCLEPEDAKLLREDFDLNNNNVD